MSYTLSESFYDLTVEEVIKVNFITEHIFTLTMITLTIVLVESILRKEQGPTITLLWLLLIILIPYVSIPIYLIFGARKIKKISQKKSMLYLKRKTHFKHKTQKLSDLTMRLLESTGAPSSTENNEIKIMDSGEKAFHSLIERIRSAQHSISISTFIFKCDDVGKKIINELINKASNDKIKIRILIDSVGSFYFHKIIARKMKKAGIELRFFLPIFESILRGRANLRNHRKLILIDDKHALIGGMNISSTYLGPKTNLQRWVDLNIEVSGNCVADLRTIFEADWSFSDKK